jgi:hypothetical protein
MRRKDDGEGKKERYQLTNIASHCMPLRLSSCSCGINHTGVVKPQAEAKEDCCSHVLLALLLRKAPKCRLISWRMLRLQGPLLFHMHGSPRLSRFPSSVSDRCALKQFFDCATSWNTSISCNQPLPALYTTNTTTAAAFRRGKQIQHSAGRSDPL